MHKTLKQQFTVQTQSYIITLKQKDAEILNLKQKSASLTNTL